MTLITCKLEFIKVRKIHFVFNEEQSADFAEATKREINLVILNGLKFGEM